ncbi:hypothetical protein WDW86_19350 [Bdellovibrionota bacterium FG-2]
MKSYLRSRVLGRVGIAFGMALAIVTTPAHAKNVVETFFAMGKCSFPDRSFKTLKFSITRSIFNVGSPQLGIKYEIAYAEEPGSGFKLSAPVIANTASVGFFDVISPVLTMGTSELHYYVKLDSGTMKVDPVTYKATGPISGPLSGSLVLPRKSRQQCTGTWKQGYALP